MGPKKKRGGRNLGTAASRANTRSRKKAPQHDPPKELVEAVETVEEINEPVPDAQPPPADPQEIKCPKKFGKFRCLVDAGKMDVDSDPPAQKDDSNDSTEKLEEMLSQGHEDDRDVAQDSELVDKLGNLEVNEPLEVQTQVEVVSEIPDAIVLEQVNVAADVECAAEETEQNHELQEEAAEDLSVEESSRDSKEREETSSPMEIDIKQEIIKKSLLQDKPMITRRRRGLLKKSISLDEEVPKPKSEEDDKGVVKKDDEHEGETETETSEDSDDKKTSSSDDSKGKKIPKSPKKVTKSDPKAAKKPIKLKIQSKVKKPLVRKKKGKHPDKLDREDENNIRRSNRIKTISSQKKTSKGKGLVKKEGKEHDSDASTSGNNADEKTISRESPVFIAPAANTEPEHKPVKVKSRWRRSSELEMNSAQSKLNTQPSVESPVPPSLPVVCEKSERKVDEEVEKRLKQFIHLKENQYLTERISCKEAKKMTCDCFMTEDEITHGEYGCGEDCLNRLLMIECGPLCTVGDRCTNKRFQKGQFAPCEVFRTDKKGLGIRASANIPYGEFVLEYVGEVLDPDEFEARATEYSKDKNQHYYFMSLRADAVIDATQKGNISRFINHSCDPNAETQKWTVNGELRIGFFSKRTILAGEEITFDYQFQRYGKEAQKCLCEAHTCRGWLGEEPDEDDEDEEEEDDEDEDEEEEEEEKEVLEKTKDLTLEEKIDEIKEVVPIKMEEEGVKIDVEKPRIVDAVSMEVTPSAEKPPKKEKKEKKVKTPKQKRKSMKEIFENLDLDDEINSLQTTGLKNQAHTLKLSRLMVRAKEITQRTKLLKLLKRGELPCRRLFLDYHGLRLLHGWMTDAQHLCRKDSKMEFLRLEILQTLFMLPIPNKTMLQDSKVLPTVEKWSMSEKPLESPDDSESNSPKSESEEAPVKEQKVEIVKEEVVEETVEEDIDLRKSLGMSPVKKYQFKTMPGINIAEEITRIFEDELNSCLIEEGGKLSETKDNQTLDPNNRSEEEVIAEILDLSSKLLEEWSGLKEVFRIPKKERIEQMKEHEREADRRYNALSVEQENLDKNRENRYRGMHRSRSSETSDSSSRPRKSTKLDDRNLVQERRKIDARQAMWRLHVENCYKIGADPFYTAPFDPSRGYHCIWNQQIGQWQNFPLPNQRMLYPPVPRYPYNMDMVRPPDPRPMAPMPQMAPMPPMTPMPPMPPMEMVPPSYAPNNNPSPVFPNNNPSPVFPNNNPSPVFPNNNPSPVFPNNNPSPAFQNNNPSPAFPNNNPSPVFPNNNPSPVFLANNPSPVFPTNNPPPGLVPPNIPPPNMQQANMGAMPPMPNIPPMPATPPPNIIMKMEEEDPSQVKFAGPIPPPVKLPPKWKCAKDKYGRPYYYHVKVRKPQWEPPEFPPEEEMFIADSETSSSSDTSSLSSDSSSSDSDSDDIDDTALMIEVRNKFKRMEAHKKLLAIQKEQRDPDTTPLFNEESLDSKDDFSTVSERSVQDPNFDDTDLKAKDEKREEKMSSLDKRLIEELGLLKPSEPPGKKRRVGLVQEIIISPRTEEDRLQFREDLKRYKQNKEKLRKEKEAAQKIKKTPPKPLPSTSTTAEPAEPSTSVAVISEPVVTPVKAPKSKISTGSARAKLKEMENSALSKKIKENFRLQMAGVMVGILNAYRRPDCKEGRIVNTDDFKHLARKLTHFVMLKELKQCQNIEDLTCTESVKVKAKEFVRKYMSKYGEVYQRPADDLDYN